jgi:predicted Rossmann fold nucleotide-binding protein DprA/Smf involved in DNA uptake
MNFESYFYFVLLTARGIGPVAQRAIEQEIVRSGMSIAEVGESFVNRTVPSALGLSEKNRRAIWESLTDDTMRDFERLQANNQWVVVPGTVLPQLYWERSLMYNLPQIFLAHGNRPPQELDWVAAIGSRRCTERERMNALAAGQRYASEGIVTVSGGAEGIDEAAVHGAQVANGWGVVVHWQKLPAGPILHERLLNLTPFHPSIRPFPGLAMARNKVIVAAATRVDVYAISNKRATTGKPSGTEDAVDCANTMGVPVRIHRPMVQ